MASVPKNQEIDVGGLLKQSWDIFMRDPVNWLLVSVVGTLALLVGGFGGFHYAALKAIRGEQVEIGDAFYIFQRPGWILPLVGVFFASTVVGFLTCGLGFLPVLFLLAWWVPLLVMFDGRPMEALKQSKDLAIGNVGPTVMVLLVALVVVIAASFIPLLGGMLATPLLVIFNMLVLQNLYQGAGAHATPQQLDYAPNAPGFAPPAAAPPAAAPSYAPPAGAPPAAAPSYAPPAAAPPAGAPPAAAPSYAPPAAAPPAAAPPTASPAASAPPAAAPPAAAPPAAEPAVVKTATTGPAAAPSAGPVETATQSTTNNPEEIVSGKTIAMSSVDFEQMLRDQQKKKDEEK